MSQESCTCLPGDCGGLCADEDGPACQYCANRSDPCPAGEADPAIRGDQLGHIESGPLAQVIRNAGFAAHRAAIDTAGTPAARTEAAVREAFRCALGNGLITIAPLEQWPAWVAVDPPYDPKAAWEKP